MGEPESREDPSARQSPVASRPEFGVAAVQSRFSPLEPEEGCGGSGTRSGMVRFNDSNGDFSVPTESAQLAIFGIGLIMLGIFWPKSKVVHPDPVKEQIHHLAFWSMPSRSGISWNRVEPLLLDL